MCKNLTSSDAFYAFQALQRKTRNSDSYNKRLILLKTSVNMFGQLI